MKKTIFIIISIIVIVTVFIIIRGERNTWVCVDGEWIKHGMPSKPKPENGCGKEIQNFDDCLEAGYVIMESYPRRCRTESGKIFIENIGNELEKIDLIQIDNPRPNQVINSPLLVKGRARGYWYFEADFPVVLTDWDGRIIAEAIAQAQGNWMTEEFVPFETMLEFEKPEEISGIINSGSLILRKDNPSGLPENDDALEIPIKFKIF
jgi:hypothetical protein